MNHLFKSTPFCFNSLFMKTRHTNSVRTLLVVFTFILLASSCSKQSDPDPLDQYVGTWNETMVNGKASTGDKVTISKSGSVLTLSGFTANDFTAIVSGSGFQADNRNIPSGVPFTFNDNSQGQIYLRNLTGSLTGDKLTLTFTVYVASSTQQVTADFTEVFTKK
jgi:hypothetical protein